jgi:hypothetical protein
MNAGTRVGTTTSHTGSRVVSVMQQTLDRGTPATALPGAGRGHAATKGGRRSAGALGCAR